jgi:hypothetical protein
MAVPTPDSIPNDTLCRALEIPNHPLILGAVTGALLRLQEPRHWQQNDPGNVSADDMAAAMKTMLEDFLEFEC